VRVVIVGGGIAAASLARHLRGHCTVVVLEQHGALSGEATAQSSGMIRRLGEDPVERTLALRSADALAAMDLPPGVWRQTGGVVALRDDPTAANDAVAHLRARGVVVDDPGPVGLLAGSPVRTRLRVTTDGVVDPERLCAGWFAESAAEVHLDTRVLALRTEAGRVVGVDTTRGAVDADHVVLAGGAWCSALATTRGLARPLTALRRSVFRVRGPEPAGSPWVWIDDRGLWARPEADTWLLSACEEVPAPPVPGAHTTGLPAPGDEGRLREKIAELLPALAGFAVVDAWSGLRTFAPDRRPLLGPDPAVPGLHWFGGLGGYGITCAWAAGELVAARMRGEEVPWLAQRAVTPDRPWFRRWPIRPTGEAGRSVLIDT
jgi:D-arginine dehydrogenase